MMKMIITGLGASLNTHSALFYEYIASKLLFSRMDEFIDKN